MPGGIVKSFSRILAASAIIVVALLVLLLPMGSSSRLPMDRDGAVLKRWKVFVFPASFVLDAKGHIRLGVFGAVEWESAELMETIAGLLPAAP
jgi:hypothetical protein